MQFTSKWTLFNIMKYLLDIKYPKIPSPVEKKLIKRRFYNVLDKVVKLHLDMLGVYLHTQYKKKTAFRKINFISLVLFEQKMFLTIFLIEC